MQVLEATCVTASDESWFHEDFPHPSDEAGVWSRLIPKHFSEGRGRDDAVLRGLLSVRRRSGVVSADSDMPPEFRGGAASTSLREFYSSVNNKISGCFVDIQPCPKGFIQSSGMANL